MKQQYKSYEQTCEFLKDCQKNYPHLITIESIGKTWEQRDIMLATISLHVENANLKPALLYTGTIHAREWIGNELAVSFIDYILNNYETNPEILQILTHNTLYIVPCLNPDGFEYSKNHFSFWRKNRRDNKDGTFGVDLNRNFSIGFLKSKDTASNVYGGPEPFSEPETLSIKNFVDAHENITIALDYHSQGNVFFPAHKFNHEAELEGTDLNTICANMNYQIHKVTGRKYGIHRGKPPKNLISGSGREYYYSKGIISAVVEVGTQNIPDYMQNMSESIHENIPALLYALSEAHNYSSQAPKRPKEFTVESKTSSEVTLKWEYETTQNIYFEIYRNNENKKAYNESSVVGVTTKNSFTDIELTSGKDYYYSIRAIQRDTKIKSPFAPQLRVQTELENDEFFRTVFPTPSSVGYVAEKTLENNRSHFGKNSLFIGVSQNRGISYGVMDFSLESLPKDAIIKEAKLSLYPLNRVNAKIEKYGEWSISFVNKDTVSDITDFDQINKCELLQTLGATIPSEKLTQGIWSHWQFNDYEKKLLQSQLEDYSSVLFRINGPTQLPLGMDSQMMMFDLGYGRFGGGIHYRPNLYIKYTVPEESLEIPTSSITTVYKDEVMENELYCGFDNQNEKIYGYMEFDLSLLPDFKQTVITQAYISIKNMTKTKSKQDIRYNLEFIDIEKLNHEDIKQRERIEFIGYEVSHALLQEKKTHHFIFDSFSRLSLEHRHENSSLAKFVIKPTSSITKDHVIKWNEDVVLTIKHIQRRRDQVAQPKNLKLSKEDGRIKLTWDNPEDKDFVGVYVVRNRFHPPSNPYDGDKLYAGKDNYTYDDFGSLNISKYFAVFSYDNVPNYSEPLLSFYEIENRNA
ncbi:MAG: M14 family zinc carboxypeptidase [Campylobacterota bacterium]